jgi:tyrosinase-like protein/polyphenol oxidase-like protein
MNTRRSIHRLLSPTGPEPEIASLRKGIAAMQRRSANNPADRTGWIYQANIHMTNSTPVQRGWNGCKHHSFFFLSWHRMYLYWFERILRAASGDPGLSLPYWDYSIPGQEALPLPFRLPADASNPLYVRERNTAVPQAGGARRAINDGAKLPPLASAVTRALAATPFALHSPASSRTFGGPITRPDDTDNYEGVLENSPHDVVHGLIGGSSGLMSYFETAARDPIFWLHHANIDRLWNAWRKGAGHADPSHDPDQEVWWKSSFLFFDEHGNDVHMTGAEIVDSAKQLNYDYDVSALSTPEVARVPCLGEAGAPPEASLIAGAIWGIGGPVEVGATPVSIVLVTRASALTSLGKIASAPAAESPIMLNVEDIRFDKNPGVTHEVYLNLPEDELPALQPRYFVGNIGFFGHLPGGHAHGGKSLGFDITANVLALEKAGQWQQQAPRVTFVPRGLLSPETGAQAEVPVEAMEPEILVQIGKVTITT